MVERPPRVRRGAYARPTLAVRRRRRGPGV